jgi:hypothetical protein
MCFSLLVVQSHDKHLRLWFYFTGSLDVCQGLCELIYEIVDTHYELWFSVDIETLTPRMSDKPNSLVPEIDNGNTVFAVNKIGRDSPTRFTTPILANESRDNYS